MEELDEDDFSDLYADVEVQASSAISVMHGLTEMPLADSSISGNATVDDGVKEENVGGSLTKLPLEDGYNYHNGKLGHGVEFDQNKHLGINANENSGDLDYVTQKKIVDETGSQVYESSEDEDADLDGEIEPCLKSAREDSRPNVGRNDADKYASERGSRLTPEPDHVSLESDKYGNVHISDSDEDDLQEVSDYKSDGKNEVMKTSDDTSRRNLNRRNLRSMSNKVPSAVKPELSRRGKSQHDPDSSCSPSSSAARSDDDVEKTRKHSSSHGLKQSTMDHRYSNRHRSPRSNYRPDFETKMNGRDTSHVTEVKGHRDMHQSGIAHGKQRVIIDTEYNEKDGHCYNRSEGFFTCPRGHFPNCHLNPAFLKTQHWNFHPSFGYGAGWCAGHNMNERQNMLASQMEYGALQDAWYENQRRYSVNDKFEDSRKLLPKYSSYAVNGKAIALSNKADGMQFRRTKGDDLSHRKSMLSSDRDREHFDHRFDRNIPRDGREMDSPERGRRRCHSPINNSDNLWSMEREANNRRYIKNQPLPFRSYQEPRRAHSERDSVYLDHRCEKNIPRDGREIEGSGRGERRLDNPFNSSDKLWRMDTEDNDRRYKKNQPLPFHSREEPCGPHREQFDGPKSGIPQRRLRYSRKDIDRKSGGYDSNISTFNEGEHVKYAEDNLVRKKHYNQSSNAFTTNGKLKSHHDEDYFVMRKCLQQPEVLQSCTPWSSRRAPKARDVVCNNGNYDLMELNDNQELKYFEDFNNFNPEKAISANQQKADSNKADKKWHTKCPKIKQSELLDIEEGQIIEIDEKPSKCVVTFENVTQFNDMENPETASNGNRIVEGLDDHKMREIIAKMERRKERFKEPVTSNRDTENVSKHLSEKLVVESAEDKLGRPARKRRWCGS